MRASRVRPYAITGGRVRPAHELTMHTRVTVAHYDPASAVDLQPESQAIYEHAVKPVTVADLAASLPTIPVPTLLVLLSDLIAEGMVTIHGDEGTTEQDMLGRILEGLRELSP